VGQEAFVRLFERGKMPDDPSAWVISVAHNLLRDWDRKRARRSRLLKVEVGSGLVAVGDPPALPDEASAGKEREAAVRSALESITPRQRELLLLRAEGYRYREIASITGMQPGSVGKTLVRAMAALSDALEEVGLAPER
jgi:RNA polymerase sigma-70 factor (ECF subfamily)